MLKTVDKVLIKPFTQIHTQKLPHRCQKQGGGRGVWDTCGQCPKEKRFIFTVSAPRLIQSDYMLRRPRRSKEEVMVLFFCVFVASNDQLQKHSLGKN